MTDYLVWKEAWNTNISDVDEQHIAMANMLNKIIVVLNQSDKGQEHDRALDRLLSDFLTLTRDHFASEEKKMRQTGYPNYAAHKSEHMMLQAELAEYILEIKKGKSEVDISTLSALKFWFIGHITSDDKAFADYYHSKRSTEINKE